MSMRLQRWVRRAGRAGSTIDRPGADRRPSTGGVGPTRQLRARGLSPPPPAAPARHRGRESGRRCGDGQKAPLSRVVPARRDRQSHDDAQSRRYRGPRAGRDGRSNGRHDRRVRARRSGREGEQSRSRAHRGGASRGRHEQRDPPPPPRSPSPIPDPGTDLHGGSAAEAASSSPDDCTRVRNHGLRPRRGLASSRGVMNSKLTRMGLTRSRRRAILFVCYKLLLPSRDETSLPSV